MTSLYRKWRSRSFEDLVGQDHVVRTLRNAVRSGRVAHAYLFTGPRGTGKTSTARILARAVNCTNPQDGNPCNACESCRAAQEGRALDVIEIDAASHTSVENVRELRERVGYAAGEGRFKVYIVDEVHRLSGAAFDAFLKTLEEPPPHVIFVFASTEPQKVPATIASRCQRFDFRRIPPDETYRRLKFVTEEEGLSASDGALELIAQGARGSLRDALGLLDQVSSVAGDQITEREVRQALGLADPLLVARLTDALLSGDTGAGLASAEDFFAAGGDPGQLTAQLIAYWRALLLAATRAPGPIEVDPGLRAEIEAHAEALDPARILAVIRALSDSEFSPRYDLVASLPFEVGFVEAALGLQRPSPARPVIQSQTSTPTAEPVKTVPRQPPPASPPSAALQTVSVPEPAPPPVAQAASSDGQVPAGDSGPLDEGTWSVVLARMGDRNKSLQAVLRSGYVLTAAEGEVTIAFLYDFHRDQFADNRKRRVLEEVIAEVLGRSYRVQCVRATKQEIETVRGAGVVPEDDGFAEEASERLRDWHARQLGNGKT